ncbi:MAG: hypothetical protein HZA34_03310 [Candidatus Pacebacteria bacterium]|nr:hypothetical protein [Candidatus Paceibacterota bacterium]
MNISPETPIEYYQKFVEFMHSSDGARWFSCVIAGLLGSILRIASDATPLRRFITDTSDIKPSLLLAFAANGPPLLYLITTGEYVPSLIMFSLSVGYAGRCLIQGMKTGL